MSEVKEILTLALVDGDGQLTVSAHRTMAGLIAALTAEYLTAVSTAQNLDDRALEVERAALVAMTDARRMTYLRREMRRCGVRIEWECVPLGM